MLLCTLLSFALLATSVAAQDTSQADCDNWASLGECEANPGYMLVHCKASCDEVERQTLKDLERIESFFDLSAKTIDGDVLEFRDFYGKVTIVVNVASYCGYTESHYRELVNLHRELAPTQKVEILAFPCNQFGQQEPEPCPAIKQFAQRKGVEFTMMDKIDVNGPNAHVVYKFLKKMAGPPQIQWNFATYFVIGPEGDVQSFSGVLPSQLKDKALDMVDREEL